MYTHFIKNETDPDRKNALIDTLMGIFDTRIEYFGKEGYVLGRKGVSLYTLRIGDFEEAYGILKKSVDLEESKSYPDVLVFYMRATKKLIDEGIAEEESDDDDL